MESKNGGDPKVKELIMSINPKMKKKLNRKKKELIITIY